jgi:hypothetical protein
MCYNAVNHWKLGWYSDREIEVSSQSTSIIRLAAFVDYGKTTSGSHYVVVKSDDIYLHYNRAKGINSDTTEYKDDMTIYRETDSASYLFAEVNADENPLYLRSTGLGTWHAQVCSKVVGDDYTPDYLIISIGYGASQCDTAPSY